jgi:hypothetical protein
MARAPGSQPVESDRSTRSAQVEGSSLQATHLNSLAARLGDLEDLGEPFVVAGFVSRALEALEQLRRNANRFTDPI